MVFQPADIPTGMNEKQKMRETKHVISKNGKRKRRHIPRSIFHHTPLARLQMMCRYKRVATSAPSSNVYQEARTLYNIWSLEVQMMAYGDFSVKKKNHMEEKKTSVPLSWLTECRAIL